MRAAWGIGAIASLAMTMSSYMEKLQQETEHMRPAANLVTCGHGCQHAPFYRGSSRRIMFYSATPNNANEGFRLALEEANKEGGTVVFGTSGTTIDGGIFIFCSARMFADETTHDVTIMNSRFYADTNCF